MYDVIVVGVGGMGSSTLWQLAKRGQRVLGLERHDLGHSLGSSHGLNRIIRLSYFEHPSYVPLLRRAYALWRETEKITGEQLLFITGSLDSSREDGRVFTGSLAACREHGLEHEVLSASQVNARFPGYRLPDYMASVFQPEGGFVASERAILAYATLAVDAGAEIKAREKVIAIEPGQGRVTVVTDKGRYQARRAVISAGAWISDLLPDLQTTTIPERQVLGWFQPKEPALFKPDVFPVSNIAADHGHYYQFPTWGIPGFKIGKYNHFKEHGHADALSREPRADDEDALRLAIRDLFPKADGPTLRLATCMFTNTPDEHFVVDMLPDHPEIVVASPCSGHGFKFASVMGEILADLATTGESRFDLDLFRYGRLNA